NALSPVTTLLADFEGSHYLAGDALAAAVGPGGHEIAGFFKKAELAGFVDGVGRYAKAGKGTAEVAPLFSAWASSSGPLTRDRVAAADAIVAYGTNPHRDHARVGRKAAEILCGIAAGTLRPTTAWRSLPLLLGGGRTIDFLPPMRAVFRRMRAAERKGEA